MDKYIDEFLFRVWNILSVIDKFDWLQIAFCIIGIIVGGLWILSKILKEIGKAEYFYKTISKVNKIVLTVIILIALYSLLIFNTVEIHDYKIKDRLSLLSIVKKSDSVYVLSYYFYNISDLPASITDAKVYFDLDKESIYLDLIKEVESPMPIENGLIRISMPYFDLPDTIRPQVYNLPLNLNYLKKKRNVRNCIHMLFSE